MRGLRLLLVVVAALLTLTACGTEDISPEAAVADAATKTEDAGSSRVSFDAEISGAALTQPVSFGGEGAFDYERQIGTLSYDMSDLLPGAGSGTIEMIQDGLVIYMKFPKGSEAELPAGKEWLKLDLAALGKDSGVDLGQLSQLNQGDPSQMLRYLRGASREVEEVGKETVRDVETTRYRATVDFKKAVEQSIDQVPEAQRDAVRASADRIVEMLGKSTAPMDVWIDGDGLARKLQFAFDIKAPGQSGTARMEMTMEFFDFGVEVDAEPPPAGETVDIQTLIGQER